MGGGGGLYKFTFIIALYLGATRQHTTRCMKAANSTAKILQCLQVAVTAGYCEGQTQGVQSLV